MMETEELGSLPFHIMTDVLRWLKAIERLEKEPKISVAFGRIASDMGVRAGTLKRKYYAYKRTRRWQSLINRAKVPAQPGNLTYSFIRFWNGLCTINNGNAKIAHKQLLAIWKQGEDIPGFSKPPYDSHDEGCPLGWSYGNLSRLYKGYRHAVRHGLPKDCHVG